jgi:beta-glucanase (GH16 family)
MRNTVAFWLLTLAVCIGCGGSGSSAPTTPPVQKETLLWSDEFTASAQSAPNPTNWTFDTGSSGFGNHELETYCAYGSSTPPCDPTLPNSYVGADGYLHIVARKDAKGNFTSARLKTQGLQSFQYGRIEARIKMPVGQGFWPAFWMLGDNITTVDWPACGEMDIMETIGSTPSVNHGSVHGTGFTGTAIGLSFTLPGGAKFSDDFHNFGLIWSPKKVVYYIDSPSNVYATFTPTSLPAGGVWPFDSGKAFFILNTAVGGDWPGSPDATSVFPQEMLVDYVRVWTEPAS